MRTGVVKMDNPVKRYAAFVSHHPFTVLAIVLILTIFLALQPSVKQAGMSYEDMLPDGIEVIDNYKILADQFAGSLSSSNIVIKVEPQYASSDEVRDIRDPRVMQYASTVANRVKVINGVTEVSSAADVLKASNDGYLPNSIEETKKLLENSVVANQYISKDYTMTLVRLNTLGDVDAEEIVSELEDAVRITKPQGVSVLLGGDQVQNAQMMKLIGPTMALSGTISMVAIVLIVVLLFMSLKHGLSSMLAIIVGLMWTFGILGLIGAEMSSATSGMLSMIMGIGIDFGIQVTMRFRYEMRTGMTKEDAMTATLSSVFTPMVTTVIAAIVGFQALKFGRLTFMAGMGTMVSIGLVSCMVAAMTVVPVALVLGKGTMWERIKEKIKTGKSKRRNEI